VHNEVKTPIESYRNEFPVTSKLIFLDHAAVTPLSSRALKAVEEFLEESSRLGASRHQVWAERVEQVRKDAAALIGAEPYEIAFVPNTSTGINHIAQGLGWYKGENIVTFAGEFPANVYPWMNLEERGVELRFVPEKGGRIKTADITRCIDGHTKLLAASAVEFLSGFRNDIKKIGSICRKEGILFCVDAIQSLGAFPMDVNASHIDFMAADSHKWLLGPEGAGILYISGEFIERLRPAYVGWKSVKNEHDFLPYHFEDLRRDAAVFELGSNNVMGVLAMGASISLLREVGLDRIASRIIDLTDKLVAGLAKRGWKVISPREKDAEKSGIISFKGKVNTTETVERLARDGIVISSRGDILRASPHFYNTFDEINDFLNALGENPV